MLALACIALLIMLYFHGKLKKQKRKAGIKGWVKSQDLDGRGKMLYQDPKTGITARPDIVLADRVIECKSSEASNKARRSDMLQLAAEMVAAHKDIGELRYANKKNFEFRINSPKMRSLRGELEHISGVMERSLRQLTPPKGTPTKNKCAKCDYRRECSESMAA